MLQIIFDDKLRSVEKINKNDFTPYHHEVINNMKYDRRVLVFQDNNWSSILLGAGEEKAVYCVCDHNNKVFAIEIIDEKHYLYGRLINGEYFFEKRLSNIGGVKFSSESLIGLTFTGLIKIREYIHGYEWGRFQFRSGEKSIIDGLITSRLQAKLISQFKFYEQHYKDVHDRNIMFELRDKKEKGIAVLYFDCSKKLRMGKVSVRAIDVR